MLRALGGNSGLAGEERVAGDVVAPGVLLATGAAEGVDGFADLHVHEADLFEECLPACTRQTTGNSAGPEVDVPLGLLGDRLPVGDVGELQDAARFEEPPGFAEGL